MIREIIVSQRKVVMISSRLCHMGRFLVETECTLQLPSLRRDIPQFEQNRTQIPLIFHLALYSHYFLQVIFRSREITSFHCQRGAKQPIASVRQGSNGRVEIVCIERREDCECCS